MNTNVTTDEKGQPLKKGAAGGYTLAEVVMAIFVAGLLFGGMINAYTNVTRNTQWSGFSLAGEALSIQSIEQARAALWDPTQYKNLVTNWVCGLNNPQYSGGVWSGYYWTNLDLPVNGGNYVRATNFITVSTITVKAGVTLQEVQVNTVWPMTLGHSTVLYTNTTVTYMAPDNESTNDL